VGRSELQGTRFVMRLRAPMGISGDSRNAGLPAFARPG